MSRFEKNEKLTQDYAKQSLQVTSKWFFNNWLNRSVRFRTLNSTLPNRVCICEARYDVMKNGECQLKQILGALLQCKKNLLALVFTNRKWSANLPKIRRYDSNRVKLNLWLHFPCQKMIHFALNEPNESKHNIRACFYQGLKTNHVVVHSQGHQAASLSTFLNSHLPKINTKKKKGKWSDFMFELLKIGLIGSTKYTQIGILWTCSNRATVKLLDSPVPDIYVGISILRRPSFSFM